MFFKKKKKRYGIDTSLDGFKYVGINLTEQQYEDLCDLNALILMNEHRWNIPVFNTMLVLKTLGLLPPEMVRDSGNRQPNNNPNTDINEALQRKFGKIIR